MASSRSYKRLAIRRPGACAACGRELPISEQAFWDRTDRTLTCLACDSVPRRLVDEPRAGASAQRKYERRRDARERRARESLGGLGVLLSRLIKEPRSTTAWKQGARGEVRCAERLEKHLRGLDAVVIHDRRVPGHGSANIDHILVGPAGVVVIDTKTHRGSVRAERIGGLLAPRREMLRIDGRDQTRLIEAVKRQVGYVRDALLDLPNASEIRVREALCFPDPDGCPCSRDSASMT
jgi:hypothetical protein